MNTTKTTPPEDSDLARLIERHLDGDPAATATLDARLASDPAAALAFAKATSMEALLATHHQRASTESRRTRFIRPLAWLAAAASLGFLAWVAFRPGPSPSPIVESLARANDTPQRRILSPLRMDREPEDEGRTHRLSAAEIEAKAARFFIPEINVNASSPDEALRQIETEFRKITSRHGDGSANGIRFETRGFEPGAEDPAPPVIRLRGGGSLETLLAAVALQAGGLLTFGDGTVGIERVPSGEDSPEQAIRAFPPNGASLIPLLTGVAQPARTEKEDDVDDPFGVPVTSRVLPELVFDEAPLEEVLEFIRVKSREADPSGKGLNIVLNPPPAPGTDAPAPTITLNLRDVPFGEALRQIAALAGLRTDEQEHALVIASPEDPLFADRRIAFELPGLRLSFDPWDGTLALAGAGDLVEAAGQDLDRLRLPSMQVRTSGRFLCVDPADFPRPAGSEGGLDLSLGNQVAEAPLVQAFLKRVTASKGSTTIASPSVVQRVAQRSKLEMIREILYRVPDSEGALGFEMAQAGWTLEISISMIGEAVRRTGVLRFTSLEKYPSARDLRVTRPQDPVAKVDPETLPIGYPLHEWSLEFDIELQAGQFALLDFMELADGKKVYALISTELIDPSGQPLIPRPDEAE